MFKYIEKFEYLNSIFFGVLLFIIGIFYIFNIDDFKKNQRLFQF